MKYKRMPDEATLRDLYEARRLTTRAIGAMYGVSKTEVGRWFRDFGIAPRRSGTGLEARGIAAPSADELRRMVHVEHLSYEQIGGLYGVHFTAVPQWLKKHGIETPKNWITRNKGPLDPLPPIDVVRPLYEAGSSLGMLAGRFGVSEYRIGRHLKAGGVEIRESGFHWKDFDPPDAATLGKMYESMSLEAVGRELGYTASFVAALLEKHGIDRRPAGFNGGRRYTCKDGQVVLSSYEQSACDWLHDHGLDYAYEPDLPFGRPGGGRSWRADFLVKGWYIEVWGVHGEAWKCYRERKLRKIELYREHALPLIQLTYKNCSGDRRGMDRKLSRLL